MAVHRITGSLHPQPSGDDPLGQHTKGFAEQLADLVDARVDYALRGRTRERYNGVPDQELVLELLARGWSVFRPSWQDRA